MGLPPGGNAEELLERPMVARRGEVSCWGVDGVESSPDTEAAGEENGGLEEDQGRLDEKDLTLAGLREGDWVAMEEKVAPVG